MDNIRIHVYISGRVQGVGYRYSTYTQALKIGIKGWVRNIYDGRVEAIFEGEEEVVEKMLEWCKNGPPMSYVSDIELHKQPYSGEFTSFKIVK